MKETARKHRLHRTTVKAILERHQIAKRARNMTATQVELAAELYVSGMSLVQVGERLGFNAQTIANRLKAHGTQIRDPHQQASSAH